MFDRKFYLVLLLFCRSSYNANIERKIRRKTKVLNVTIWYFSFLLFSLLSFFKHNLRQEHNLTFNVSFVPFIFHHNIIGNFQGSTIRRWSTSLCCIYCWELSNTKEFNLRSNAWTKWKCSCKDQWKVNWHI